jgi:hypothetical protein
MRFYTTIASRMFLYCNMLMLFFFLTAANAYCSSHGFRGGYSLSWQTDRNTSLTELSYGPYFGYMNFSEFMPALNFVTGIEYQTAGHRSGDASLIKQHIASVPLYLRLRLGPVAASAGLHSSAAFATISKPEYFGKDSRKLDVGAFGELGAQFFKVGLSCRTYFNLIERDKNYAGKYYSRIVQLGLNIKL